MHCLTVILIFSYSFLILSPSAPWALILKIHDTNFVIPSLGTPFIIPGPPKPCRSWPWTRPGMESVHGFPHPHRKEFFPNV